MSAVRFNAQQAAVVDWVTSGRGSLNVVARAGTGKTFLLVRGVVRRIVERELGEVAIMAYNKAAADEFKARIKRLGDETGDRRFTDWRRVSAGTVHSFGFGAVRRRWPDVTVDDKKVYGIIDGLADEARRGNNPRLERLYADDAAPIAKLVSLGKQAGFGALVSPGDARAWYDLALHHAVDDLADGTALDDIVRAAETVLRSSLALDPHTVDFDDMVLAPLAHSLRLWPKDWVLIDEAQDTNAARRALALKMLRPVTGRLVAVGDDRQAIYGFTGADDGAMDLIARELDSARLPLSVTYRCPKRVVAEANRLVPDLEAHHSAPEGRVRTVPDSLPETIEERVYDRRAPIRIEGRRVPWYESEGLAPADAVLCRNVKPLVALAYDLLAAGTACRVEGREIGEGLVRLATRWKRVSSLGALDGKLEEYAEREVQKWQAKGREDRAQAAEDQVGALRAIIRGLTEDTRGHLDYTVDALVRWVRELFEGGAGGVTLTTIHKAKGREWPRVFLLYPIDTLPSPWARKPWQLRQEENLEYVAVTRAERELVYVEPA